MSVPGVYAYAGAQLFVEFMAELQRPRDFLKAMWGAQFFIYACYMIFGCYTYYFQGQYSNQVSLNTCRLSHHKKPLTLRCIEYIALT